MISFNTVIFSGDSELVSSVSEYFRYINGSKPRQITDSAELSRLFGSFPDTGSEHLLVVFDTLYSSFDVCRLIIERLKCDAGFLCLIVCERSDPGLFEEYPTRVVRLDKPFHSFELSSAVCELKRAATVPIEPGITGTTLRAQVCELLHALGIPINVSGYDCLRQALCEILADETLMKKSAKAIYLRVGEQLELDSETVERSIRRAINIAWRRGRLQCSKLFAHCGNERPTSTEFMRIAIEYLSDRLSRFGLRR